jgi:hypothetical protein
MKPQNMFRRLWSNDGAMVISMQSIFTGNSAVSQEGLAAEIPDEVGVETRESCKSTRESTTRNCDGAMLLQKGELKGKVREESAGDELRGRQAKGIIWTSAPTQQNI